jgi:hypothetical protein
MFIGNNENTIEIECLNEWVNVNSNTNMEEDVEMTEDFTGRGLDPVMGVSLESQSTGIYMYMYIYIYICVYAYIYM